MDKKANKISSGGSLKLRFAQLLLGSSCTTTSATTATNLVKLSNINSGIPPPEEPEGYSPCPRRKLDRHLSFPAQTYRTPRRVAPVLQVSINCGARRFIHASEPLLPLSLMEEEKNKKKERRVTENGDFYETGECEGRKCPPASPSSPSKNYYCSHREPKKNKKTSERKHKAVRKEAKKLLSNAYGFSSTSSFDSDNEFGLFSSEDEEEKESSALFSSKSFSSDSSEFYRNNCRKEKKKKNSRNKSMKIIRRPPPRRGNTKTFRDAWGTACISNLQPLVSISSTEKKEMVEAETEAGFAVVKRSSDPYMDFRSSMVEMIVERRLTTASDLECLFMSYITLNSARHHPVILEAFADIWEAIFGKSYPNM